MTAAGGLCRAWVDGGAAAVWAGWGRSPGSVPAARGWVGWVGWGGGGVAAARAPATAFEEVPCRRGGGRPRRATAGSGPAQVGGAP